MQSKKKYHVIPLGEEQLEEVLTLESLSFSTPWSKEQYSKLLSAGICKLFGIISGKELCAYIAVAFMQAAEELEIYNIAVKAEARRKGMGKELLACVFDNASKRGITRAILEVREGNLPARALYEKFGFVCCGQRKNYYSSPVENALIYEYIFK